MKQLLKVLSIGLLSLLSLAILVGIALYYKKANTVEKKYQLLGERAANIIQEGITFRDLNKNGKLDPYEDFRNPIDSRVEDLMGRMQLD